MLSDFVPNDWQQDYLPGIKQNTFVEVHRRGGKSFANAHICARQILLPVEGRQTLFISPYLKQTRLTVWGYFKQFLDGYSHIKFLSTDSVIVNTQTNSRILLLGMSDPDSNRGLEGHLCCVDEIGGIEYQQFHDVILPFVAQTRGTMILSGTPPLEYTLFAEQRDFHRLKAKTDPDNFAFFSYPASTTNVFTPAELTTMGQRSPRSFQREYELNPDQGDELTYAPQNLITTLTSNDPYKYLAETPPVAGFDVALKRDSSVVTIRHDHHVPHISIVNGTPAEQVQRVYKIMNEHKCTVLGVDSGGLGEAFTEPLEALQDRDVLLDVYFTRFNERADDPSKDANKRSMIYHRLQDWMYLPTSCLPQHHELLVDLGSQRLKSNDKNLFTLERKELVKARIGRSCDFSDSLALTFIAGADGIHAEPKDVMDTETLPNSVAHLTNAQIMDKYPELYEERWRHG